MVVPKNETMIVSCSVSTGPTESRLPVLFEPDVWITVAIRAWGPWNISNSQGWYFLTYQNSSQEYHKPWHYLKEKDNARQAWTSQICNTTGSKKEREWRKISRLHLSCQKLISLGRRSQVAIRYTCHEEMSNSKWFETRSISSSYCVIVWVRVVLKRTVVGDWLFDNLSGSHLQSQVNSICQSMML